MEYNNLENKVFAAGDLLLKQGDAGENAYYIISGKVRVFIERDSKVVDLAILGEGEIVGEMSLLTGYENAASVIALEEVSAGIITHEKIKQVIEESSPLLKSILKMLVERVRQTDTALLRSETREYIEIDFL